MSQLIDRLNRVAKAAPQPMGFRAQPAPVKPQLLLIASLGQAENLAGLAEHVSGADAVLARITRAGPETKAVQKLVRSLPDVPWGAWLDQIDEKEATTLADAGADFMVFPADSAVSAMPRDSKAGKVLRIGPSLAEGMLRAIDDLPVDAILVADESQEKASLTWRHLMFFQRAAGLSKPLLVVVPSKPTAGELETLWGIGVDGIVVEVDRERPAELKELRQAIGKLAGSPRRKRGRVEALVPSIRTQAPAESQEEEEEDE